MELKCLSLFDLEVVREWRNEQMGMLRTSLPLTGEMQKQFYKDIICNRQSNARYWGIWHNNRFIGMCGIENIQWENRLGEISLLLNPEKSLEQYGIEILQRLLYEGFNNLNLENIYAEVYASHPQKTFWDDIAKKYNCKTFILPNRKYYNGKYHDSIYINFKMLLLEQEFNERRGAKYE